MSDKLPENKLTIRNSTAELLIFTRQAGENGIEVRYEEWAIGLTQKLMAELFDVSTSAINQLYCRMQEKLAQRSLKIMLKVSLKNIALFKIVF